MEEMRFCGESEDTIARALGIATNTLRKHFTDEIANGHAARRKEVIGMLFKSARDGNVSAQRKLEELGKVGAAEEAVGRRSSAPKIGKKEERRIAAENVGGKFATPAPPKLVVNNRK
ncbi:hypothetical protein [Mesorhizobium sp. CAU 1741]|uniref:hypothetical protein n=1 Tax=Mesorhizobium sp. CAU 1741 TaxID=3140366 RepID=UPI00325B607F